MITPVESAYGSDDYPLTVDDRDLLERAFRGSPSNSAPSWSTTTTSTDHRGAARTDFPRLRSPALLRHRGPFGQYRGWTPGPPTFTGANGTTGAARSRPPDPWLPPQRRGVPAGPGPRRGPDRTQTTADLHRPVETPNMMKFVDMRPRLAPQAHLRGPISWYSLAVEAPSQQLAPRRSPHPLAPSKSSARPARVSVSYPEGWTPRAATPSPDR